ncbi:MAPEG family protein [Mesorhizobium sp. M7A.F.Ca.CA.001.09.2.1]|uniref:Membrane-associated protein in eicosanoid and glutathione metabolism (MAPEG) n=2 Tax=Mesorhizobium ciceri TaxID=39645 RepID=E8TP31_MESCW|nr:MULTISPECIES: MAPEG family protein [Mesorhizobium]RUY28390.1 MAPEG family protein [Mesorhizobium sp. M7A.F.Ca.CA.001.13.2.1]ADV15066.1 membrane-associated protein in eicosanoid and glutathione metabolism (MAPEG) [Mesorhizobium ciceri biovar biserrulae WSM1271]MDF3218509.1 MAPEG family protein [Mesorhizobium ciceri]RUY64258.1 MAPEG family protein [Mesorhizobium sp. M7A.F.Ca.CA.001.13.1.1]RUY68953.1 MAPEG family protein [Mesorhizobium sp. M7A.F.Ca.CA.001.05.1.1]
MERYFSVAIVTLLCSLMIFGIALTVARTHKRTGVLAPTMTGDPLLERTIRANSNSIEWLPIFLPSMWLFAVYWSAPWAAALGLLWIMTVPVGTAEAVPRLLYSIFRRM